MEGWVQAQRFDDGLALLDSLEAAAVAAGDEGTAIKSAVNLASLLFHTGRAEDAVRKLNPLLPRIEARGDTLFYCRAAALLGRALFALGRNREAGTLYGATLPLALRARLVAEEGWFRQGIAYSQFLDGKRDEALAEYRRAREALREAGMRQGELDVLLGIGRVHSEKGEGDRAVAAFREVAAIAGELGLDPMRASALNNVGTEEYLRGDPGAALAAYRESAELWRKAGGGDDALAPAANTARSLMELGRLDEALGIADSILTLGRSTQGQGELMALALLTELREREGDGDGLIEAAKMILAMGERAPARERMRATMALARGLSMMGRTDEAIEVMRTNLRPLLEGGSTDDAVESGLLFASLHLDAGRFEEAVMVSTEAASLAERIGRFDFVQQLATLAAEAELRRGRFAEAHLLLERAVAAWESHRSQPSAPEWRERRAASRRLCSAVIRASLDDPGALSEKDRITGAFDSAQRFKSRALLERIRANRGELPGIEPDQPVTLEMLQQEVLRPGEVFLDSFAGTEASFIFAVTPETVAVTVLPGAAILEERIRLLYDLVAAPQIGAGEERSLLLETARGRITSGILGALAPILRDCRTLLWAPDGPFTALPIETLALSSSDRANRVPMGTLRTVARMPSASLLARIRTRGNPSRTDPLRGLVLLGSRNRAGEPLRGAESEARALQRRYSGIEIYQGTGGSTGQAAAKLLAEAAFLHVAAHTELDDRYPWRSAILLNSDGEEEEIPLRADSLARAPLRASLAFLSGCESAGGQVLPGEGVLGLSSALLAAGVPCVVATLWPIDDRSAARFVELFYDAMDDGMPAGEALRQAREAMVASEDRDPFHWAGFVLLGEPDLTMNLERRIGATPYWIAGAILLAAAALLGARRRRMGPGQKKL